MKILGIDPGYDRLGWAILELHKQTSTFQAYGCIETNSRLSLGKRYLEITKKLIDILETHQPSALAIEKLYFAKNTTTALKVSESRGLVFATCLPRVKLAWEFAPSEIKLAVTGNGQSNKAAVLKMMQLQTKLDLHQEKDDAVDAMAVALTFAQLYSPLTDAATHAIL